MCGPTCCGSPTTPAHCPRKGDARYWTIEAGGRESRDAVWGYPEVIEGCPDITAYVSFYWNRVDAWFEEDDEVFVHARDPYKRVDVLRSSRHVVVRIDGEVVADSHRPLLLFETGLPTRYYLPRLDVRADVLLPSATTTRCPYKGIAEYHSVHVGDTVHDDVVWFYPSPIPEIPKIEQHLCFFNERVDIEVDGVHKNALRARGRRPSSTPSCQRPPSPSRSGLLFRAGAERNGHPEARVHASQWLRHVSDEAKAIASISSSHFSS